MPLRLSLCGTVGEHPVSANCFASPKIAYRSSRRYEICAVPSPPHRFSAMSLCNLRSAAILFIAAMIGSGSGSESLFVLFYVAGRLRGSYLWICESVSERAVAGRPVTDD